MSWSRDYPRPDLVQRYREAIRTRNGTVGPVGHRQADYIDTITQIVGFFREYQAENGAILCPIESQEWYYSTPCFAFAAAVLVQKGRSDLRDRAELAMIWASEKLKLGCTPQNHPDFFTVFLVLADELLCSNADAERLHRWRDALRQIDPPRIYQDSIEKQPSPANWNAINIVGEYLRHRAGLGGDPEWWEGHLPLHLSRFNQFGLYRDGEGTNHPTAYDTIARYTLGLMIHYGYNGAHAEALRDSLLRGAVTSLFVQSPVGEWPGIGRSGHHHWSDAALASAYEFAANHFWQSQPVLASACKRGARLAWETIRRWHRRGGDLYIVRNRFEPRSRHGFEPYSNHTNYNLWTAAALSVAFLIANDSIPEALLPSEVDSYVLQLDDAFHQVLAGHHGMYIEVDSRGTADSNPTGLLRINRTGCNPQIGPSDGSVHSPRYSGLGACGFLSYAPSWCDRNGLWQKLAALASFENPLGVPKPRFQDLSDPFGPAAFSLEWLWVTNNCESVTAIFRLHDDGVDVRYDVAGNINGLRAEFPIMYSDGLNTSRIETKDRELSVIFGGSRLQIRITTPSAHIVLTDQLFLVRTGMMRLAYSEITGHSIEFSITLKPDETG